MERIYWPPLILTVQLLFGSEQKLIRAIPCCGGCFYAANCWFCCMIGSRGLFSFSYVHCTTIPLFVTLPHKASQWRATGLDCIYRSIGLPVECKAFHTVYPLSFVLGLYLCPLYHFTILSAKHVKLVHMYKYNVCSIFTVSVTVSNQKLMSWIY